MTDTVIRNSIPVVPIANLIFVSGYESGQQIENILHPQLNGTGYNITYRPARLRAGTLRLLFATPAQAAAAITVLLAPNTFTLTADVAQVSMTFVLRPGVLRPVLTEDVVPWMVEVPFQEVAP